MLVDRLVKLLLPREDHFFDLLEKGADCAVRSAQVLHAICSSPSATEREELRKKLQDVEHESDGVIHEVYDALNRTFVTPIDRSDIYTLANQLEDIVDLNHATAMQLVVHAIDELPAGSKELGALIEQAAKEAQQAVTLLRGMKKPDEVRARCRALSKLEHDGDEIYRAKVGALFRDEKNAVRLIQHKEFLEGLERTLDACDHTGHALSAIVIKNG